MTLGAVIRFPAEFADVHQFIGQIDSFGMMNSRPFVERFVVPGAWHSLNTLMPGHLSVKDTLQVVRTRGAVNPRSVLQYRTGSSTPLL